MDHKVLVVFVHFVPECAITAVETELNTFTLSEVGCDAAINVPLLSDLHRLDVRVGFGLTSCYHFLLREYHYVNMKMSWADAQHYCRDKYTDLATIVSTDDIRSLDRPNTDDSPLVWIGLRDDPQSWNGVMGNDANSWRWSTTGNTSTTGYHNWVSPHPNNAGGKQTCVLVDSTGKWNDFDCPSERRFVCYTATNPAGQKTYTLSDNKLNWEDARSYCRTHYTDLAMIENAQEQADFVSVMSTDVVWIGLYRVSWRWSDKSSSSFRNWRSPQPDNYQGNQYCAVENSNHLWDDISCGTKLPFFCHVLTIKMTIVRMKIQTDGDLSDPATNAQILQQLVAVLKSKTLQTDINLRWRIQPRKQEEDSEASG